MFLLFFLLVEYHCLAVLFCSVSTTEAGNLSSVITSQFKKYAVFVKHRKKLLSSAKETGVCKQIVESEKFPKCNKRGGGESKQMGS